MNKETFIAYMDNPAKLDQESLSALSSLVKDFPYCQTSRILYTLNLAVTKNVVFDRELNTTAIYLTDRKRLKQHLDEVLKVDQEISEEFQKEAVQQEPEALKTDEKTVRGPEPEEWHEKQSDTTPAESVNQPQIAKKPKEKPIERIGSSEESVESEKELPEPEEKLAAESAEPKVLPQDHFEDPLADLKRIVSARLENIEAERKKAQKDEVEETSDEPAVPETGTTSPKSISELIDDFIKNEPTVSRPQASFFDPVEASKDSVVDEENIVSETLATIYYDQGYYEKAIKIYRKLSLNYPEKSSYFARLIEKALEELKK